MDILIFELGSIRFALPSADVRELHRAVALVSLPKAPPIVEGIISVRGRIVPVLDIRARFRLPARAPFHTDHLILALAGERLVALRVDGALDVVHVDPQQLEGPEAVGNGVGYVAGVAKLHDGIVLIHDLATFLDAAERDTLNDAVAAAELGASE
jgi:purine-binding chemotaxis protein CheW